MKKQNYYQFSRTQKPKSLIRLAPLLLIFFIFMSSCQSELDITQQEIESSNENINKFLKFQNSFNSEYINKSLQLGKGNFQVNWSNYDIIHFDKKTNTTIYEFEAFVKRKTVLESNLFSGEIIYKIIVTEESEQNYSFNILRFEPYKTSLNKNPSTNNIENYDGLKFTLQNNGKIKDIETFEKGMVIASFKKDILEKQNNSDALNKESVVSPICDNSSMFYNSIKCYNGGGTGSSGWVRETTTSFTDWYKSEDQGATYYYTHTRVDSVTSRWVWVNNNSGNHFINSYTSENINHGGKVPPPRSPDEDRIFNELTEKAECVFDKLNISGTKFADAIKKFDGEFPVSHLKFENSSTLPSNVNAKTKPPVNNLITIQINQNNLARPNLSIARTFIHEIIHAEMFRKILSIMDNGGDLDGLSQSQWTSKLSNGDYPGIFDYYSRFGVNNMQHEQMAAHYINTISDMLEEFQPDLSEDLYEALAWEGLKSTTAWNDLTTADKNSINSIISNYNSSGSEDCN